MFTHNNDNCSLFTHDGMLYMPGFCLLTLETLLIIYDILYIRGSRFLNRDLLHCAIVFIKNLLKKKYHFKL
jgi:hypothetical protein